MHCDCGIAEHRLRAGGRDLEHPVSPRNRVIDMPEVPRFFLVGDLCFGDRGFAVGAPVDNPFAAVDQALFIEIDEHLLDRLVAALIHREPLTFPIAGGTQLFQLADNPPAILFFPFPCAF